MFTRVAGQPGVGLEWYEENTEGVTGEKPLCALSASVFQYLGHENQMRRPFASPRSIHRPMTARCLSLPAGSPALETSQWELSARCRSLVARGHQVSDSAAKMKSPLGALTTQPMDVVRLVGDTLKQLARLTHELRPRRQLPTQPLNHPWHISPRRSRFTRPYLARRPVQ